MKVKFKKGDVIICQWRDGDTDITTFKKKYDEDSFMMGRGFLRIIKTNKVESLKDDGGMECPMDYFDSRKVIQWRKITKAEKVKYFDIILKSL